MHGVTQDDLGDLERGIKRLTQSHVPQVAGQRDRWCSPILPVGVEALRGQNGLHLLEKNRIHACKLGVVELLFVR